MNSVDFGEYMMNKSEQGKKNRKSGGVFELKVRKDLESKGWIVSKWQNNVECVIYNKETCRSPEDWGECKLVPAKRKYNPFNKALSIGTGFPDFIAFKLGDTEGTEDLILKEPLELGYNIIGVEAKSNGYLDKTEKEKYKWLLDNKIFGKILIAKKGEKKSEIIYTEFKND